MSHEPKPSEHAMRAAFEAWIIAPPIEKDIARNSLDALKSAWPGQYESYEVQLAYEAWAEASHAIAPAVAERDRRIAELEGLLKRHLHELKNMQEKLAAKEEECWEGSMRRCVLSMDTTDALKKS